MANRYNTSNPDRKITAPAPPKDKRGNPTYSYPVKTHAWVRDIGPVGERRQGVAEQGARAEGCRIHARHGTALHAGAQAAPCGNCSGRASIDAYCGPSRAAPRVQGYRGRTRTGAGLVRFDELRLAHLEPAPWKPS